MSFVSRDYEAIDFRFDLLYFGDVEPSVDLEEQLALGNEVADGQVLVDERQTPADLRNDLDLAFRADGAVTDNGGITYDGLNGLDIDGRGRVGDRAGLGSGLGGH